MTLDEARGKITKMAQIKGASCSDEFKELMAALLVKCVEEETRRCAAIQEEDRESIRNPLPKEEMAEAAEPVKEESTAKGNVQLPWNLEEGASNEATSPVAAKKPVKKPAKKRAKKGKS